MKNIEFNTTFNINFYREAGESLKAKGLCGAQRILSKLEKKYFKFKKSGVSIDVIDSIMRCGRNLYNVIKEIEGVILLTIFAPDEDVFDDSFLKDLF